MKRVLKWLVLYLLAGSAVGPPIYALGAPGEEPIGRTLEDMNPKEYAVAIGLWPATGLYVLAFKGWRSIWDKAVPPKPPVTQHTILLEQRDTEIVGFIDGFKALDSFPPTAMAEALQGMSHRILALGFEPAPDLDPKPESESGVTEVASGLRSLDQMILEET